MNIYAVIPSYNAEDSIAGIIKAIKKLDIKVAVVDDGSTDNTEEIARKAGAIVLHHRKNEGKGAALRNGFNYILSKTESEAVITLDSDGQHNPANIFNFISEAYKQENIGVVVGNRLGKPGKMPGIRILTNKFMSWAISRLCKQEIPDTQCGFRLVKRPVLEGIKLMTSNFEIESETLIRASRLGYKIVSIPIETIYSKKISSKINPIIDTLRFIVFILKEIWISLY